MLTTPVRRKPAKGLAEVGDGAGLVPAFDLPAAHVESSPARQRNTGRPLPRAWDGAPTRGDPTQFPESTSSGYDLGASEGEMQKLRKVIHLQSQEVELLYKELEARDVQLQKKQSQCDGALQNLEVTKAQLWRCEEELHRTLKEVATLKGEKTHAEDARKQAIVEGEAQLLNERQSHQIESLAFRNQISRLDNEVHEARGAAEDLRRQLEEATQQVTACVATIASSEKTVKGMETERTSMRLECDELKARIALLLSKEARVEEVTAALLECQARAKHMEAQLSSRIAENECVQKKVSKAQARVLELEEQLADLKEERDKLQQDAGAARHSRDDALDEAARLRMQLSSVASEVGRLSEQVDALRRAEEAKEKAQREARGAGLLLEQSEGRCRELLEEKEQLQEVMRRSKEEERAGLMEVRAQLERARAEREQVDEELARVRTQLHGAKGELERAKAAADEERRKYEGCAARAEGLEKRVKKHKAEAESLRACMSEVQEGQSEVEEEKGRLVRQVARLKEEVKELRGKGREYAEVTSEMLNELEALKTDRGRRMNEVGALKAALHAAQTGADRTTAMCQALQRERDDALAQLGLERRRCDGLEREVQDAAQRIVAYEREVQEVRTETERSSAQLETLRRMLGSSAGTTDAVAQLLKRTTAHIQRAGLGSAGAAAVVGPLRRPAPISTTAAMAPHSSRSAVSTKSVLPRDAAYTIAHVYDVSGASHEASEGRIAMKTDKVRRACSPQRPLPTEDLGPTSPDSIADEAHGTCAEAAQEVRGADGRRSGSSRSRTHHQPSGASMSKEGLANLLSRCQLLKQELTQAYLSASAGSSQAAGSERGEVQPPDPPPPSMPHHQQQRRPSGGSARREQHVAGATPQSAASKPVGSPPAEEPVSPSGPKVRTPRRAMG